MKKFYRLFATLSAVAVINGAFGTTTAQADDGKVFPGGTCYRLSGGTANYTSNGRLFNSSAVSAMTVICPIVRDLTQDPWVTIEVVAIDQHLNQNVICRGYSYSRDGGMFGVTAPLPTAGNGNVGQVIDLGGGVWEEARGYYFAKCDIPPVGAAQSGIASYIVVEP
jgi:hypothetical protein